MLFGNFGDRAGAVAHAGGKTRKIVNGADQDNSECYPQQARQPAKARHAAIGPAIGPAAAMAEKC